MLSLQSFYGDYADVPPQKQQQQKDANAEGAAGTKKKKVTAAQLRVQKGIPPLPSPPSPLRPSQVPR